MIGRASVIAVYCATVYFGLWDMIQDSGNQNLLGLAFILAFLSADEPWVKYVKEEKTIITRSEEEKIE